MNLEVASPNGTEMTQITPELSPASPLVYNSNSSTSNTTESLNKLTPSSAVKSLFSHTVSDPLFKEIPSTAAKSLSSNTPSDSLFKPASSAAEYSFSKPLLATTKTPVKSVNIPASTAATTNSKEDSVARRTDISTSIGSNAPASRASPNSTTCVTPAKESNVKVLNNISSFNKDHINPPINTNSGNGSTSCNDDSKFNFTDEVSSKKASSLNESNNKCKNQSQSMYKTLENHPDFNHLNYNPILSRRKFSESSCSNNNDRKQHNIGNIPGNINYPEIPRLKASKSKPYDLEF